MVCWWFPELDLTPGALTIKWVSGVAGVPDVVVLSALSGLVCSRTWEGSWAGLIAWWLCWRSSRLDSTYRKASVRKSLCPKTRLSALKSLSCFRLSDPSCGSCLRLHQGLQDTGTLRTGVFFSSWHQPLDKAWLHAGCGQGLAGCRLWANFSNSTESIMVFVIFQCFFRKVFDNFYSWLSLSFGFGAVWW